MTREEALETWLPVVEMAIVDANIPEAKEALEMAFKALEQEPCDDAISREAAICLVDELKDDLPDDDHLSDMVMSHNEGILEYQTKLSLLPSVTPAEDVTDTDVGEMPCEDCISREAAHGLLLPWLNDYLLDETREVLETIDYKIEDLPSVYPVRTECEDAISRAELVRKLNAWDCKVNAIPNYVWKVIRELPPVTPAEKTLQFAE